MEERQYYGRWWEPDRPEGAQSGILTIATDGECRLELVGGFDLTVRTPIGSGGFAIHSGSRALPHIYGDCEGKAFSLLDCVQTFARGGYFSDRPSFQRLLAPRVVIGAHVASLDDATYRSATLRLENFTSWAALPTIAHSFGFDDGVSKAEIRLVDGSVATFDGWKFEARPSLRGFNAKRLRESDEVSGDATTELRITPPTPVKLSDFDRIAMEFSDLLTLAMNTPCGLIGLIVDLPEDEIIPLGEGNEVRRPKTAEVVGVRIRTAEPSAPATLAHKWSFNCTDLPFEVVVPRWLELRRAAPAACNIFFGLQYARPQYTELRLLALAIVVETLHRNLYGDVTDMPQAKFEKLRQTAVNALDSKEDRAWLKRNLRNQPSFRERARELASIPTSAAVTLVVPVPEQWARELVEARNGLAHTGGQALGFGVFNLAQRTSALLDLVLMARLGLSDEVQTRVAQNISNTIPSE